MNNEVNKYRVIILCAGNFLVIKDIEAISILKVFNKFENPAEIKSIECKSNMSENYFTEFAIKEGKVHIAPSSITGTNLIEQYWPETNIELIHFIKK